MLKNKATASAVLMTQVAMVMFLYAFWVAPWYEVTMTGDASTDRDPDHNAGEYTYFPDEYIWTSAFDRSTIFEYSGDDPFFELMKLEGVMTGASIILGLFFVAALALESSRFDLYVVSGLLIASCAAIVLYFVLRADDAVKEFFSTVSAMPVDGFYGTATDASSRDWSWGPLSGFFFAVGALLLQIASATVANFSRSPRFEQDLDAVDTVVVRECPEG